MFSKTEDNLVEKLEDVCVVEFRTRAAPKELPDRPEDPMKLAKHVVDLAVGTIDERPAKRKRGRQGR